MLKTLLYVVGLHFGAIVIALAGIIPGCFWIIFISTTKRDGGPADDIFCHFMVISFSTTVFSMFIACDHERLNYNINNIRLVIANIVCFLSMIGLNTLERLSYFSWLWLVGVYCKGCGIWLAVRCWKLTLGIVPSIFTSIEKYIHVPSLRSILNGNSTISINIDHNININTSIKNNEDNHSGMFDSFLLWLFIDKNFYKFLFQTCSFKVYFFVLKFIDFMENEQYLCLMLSWIDWDYDHPWNHAHTPQCQNIYDNDDDDYDNDENFFYQSRYRNPIDPNLNLLGLRYNFQFSYPIYPNICDKQIQFEQMLNKRRFYAFSPIVLDRNLQPFGEVAVSPIEKVYLFYDNKWKQKIHLLFISFGWGLMLAMKWICYFMQQFIIDKEDANSFAIAVYFGVIVLFCRDTLINNTKNNNSMCKDLIEKSEKTQQEYIPCIRFFSFCQCILPSKCRKKYRIKISEKMFRFYYEAVIGSVFLLIVIFTNDEFKLNDCSLVLIAIVCMLILTLFFACVNMRKLIHVVKCHLCFTIVGSIITFPLLILGLKTWHYTYGYGYSIVSLISLPNGNLDKYSNLYIGNLESILLIEELFVKILFSNCRIILLLSWIWIINIAIGREIYDLTRSVVTWSLERTRTRTDINATNGMRSKPELFKLSSLLSQYWDHDSRLKAVLMSFMLINNGKNRLTHILLMPTIVWLCLIVDDTNKIDILWICLLMFAHSACRLELSSLIFDQSYRNIFLMIEQRNKRLKILKSKRKRIKAAKKCIDSIYGVQELESILTKQIIIECCYYWSVDVCLIIWQYLY